MEATLLLWRRRSWPYPPTDRELLAARAGLDDDELRESLRSRIAARRPEIFEPDEIASADDSGWRELLHPEVVREIERALTTLS